jgi:hypothetical protein
MGWRRGNRIIEVSDHLSLVGKMVPDSFEETVPDTGSPALSMKAAPFGLRTTENPLESEGRVSGSRHWIIESAGEPRYRRT